MCGDESEAALFEFDFYLAETAQHVKTSATVEVTFASVMTDGGEGMFAEESDVEICVPGLHMLPIREVEAVLLERGAQFEECVRRTDFLQCDEIGIHRANALPDDASRLLGFWFVTERRSIDVEVEIVGGDRERARENGARNEQQQNDPEALGDRLARRHGATSATELRMNYRPYRGANRARNGLCLRWGLL